MLKEQNRIQLIKLNDCWLTCLKGLVDVLRATLISLFHWQLCLFELQELAPKKLKVKKRNTKKLFIVKLDFPLFILILL